jgi:gamma-glutamyl-gamma-aminobutyrate hydrolase PuuD
VRSSTGWIAAGTYYTMCRSSPIAVSERFSGTAFRVNSHHHQAPDKVGTGLVDVAWTPDGTIEGLEDPSAHFVVGVQWHPEEGDGLALFDALIEAAR